MSKTDLDMLLNQIKNIILNKPISEEFKTESEDIADLQEAIYYLSNCLSESNEFLKQLAIGNLDAKPPSRHNFLAGSLKELHSGLKHLTWQANQVAKGDYNQRVSFLGDFSVFFNKMISQLCERELKLKEQSSILTETNTLMMSIMDGVKDWIIVTGKDTGEIIYANQSAKELFYNPDIGNSSAENSDKKDLYKHSTGLLNCLKQHTIEAAESTIDYNCPISNKNFRIRTFLMQWHDSLAYVHYILDITYEKEELEQIEELAYKDELTNLYNRRYCVSQLDYLLNYKVDFSFCMIDLDGLKFANDNFGHAAGDEYLKAVANEMLSITRNVDIVSRFGGDEFAIIFPSCPVDKVEEKMEMLNKNLSEMGSAYPMSISYGAISIDGNNQLSSENIMAEADEKMYVQKKLKKASK